MPEGFVYNVKERNKVRIVDIIYRQDEDGSWPVRIYMPEKQGSFPALLDVHGGAWTSGGCSDNENIDLSLAASGMVVFAIECRKAPKYTYPAQVIDINYATRWIKAHAADYNADSEHLGGFATSSGGHGLFLSAMRPDDHRYDKLQLIERGGLDARLSYLIVAWPVLDPYGRYFFAQENNRDFLVEATNSYFLSHDAMIEGSPLLALERGEQLNLPPALIIQGTADNNIPLASIYRFADAYRSAGGVIDLEWFLDMPHGFACKPGIESDRALEIMKRFVGRQLTRSALAL
jgi:acetyl esterase